MEQSTKELMKRMKAIFEKEKITEYIFFEDRIDQKHSEYNPRYDDASSYYSLDLSIYPPAFYTNDRSRGCPFYNAKTIYNTYKTIEEALKCFYVRTLYFEVGRPPINDFYIDHKNLQVLGDKSYPNLCVEAVIDAFQILQIPKTHYHFYTESNFGIVLSQKKEKYMVQYFNSAGILSDQYRCVTEESALRIMYYATCSLVWWEAFIKRIKEEGEEIFHLEEKDYEKYII